MLKEVATKVVDHALARIDLHLGAVRRHELVHDLQNDAGDDDDHEQREEVVACERGDPRLQPLGERLAAEARRHQHVVDDDGHRPRLQGPEPDLRREQRRQQDDATAIRPQKRQRPRKERFLFRA